MTIQGNTLILGRDGQVGRALTRLLGAQAIAAGHREVDFLDRHFTRKLETWIGRRTIYTVINAAAYTAVDEAEDEGKEAAFRVNGEAVGELATWCKKRNLPLVHYSTDYVFDGSGSKPWRENDTPRPINAYGESKLAGENALKKHGGNYLLIRTSWVYDAHGKNFFTTIQRALQEKGELRVVANQFGAPTYAAHLAKATLQTLSLREKVATKSPGGEILHLCNSGATSWHGFANEIFALARRRGFSLRCRRINPIPASEYPLPARRPLNSRLDCSAAAMPGVTLPPWQEGLKECIEEYYADSGLQDRGA
ncbi:MAG: dTDP-4-dehydrorhamnose reductase [Pseudomonadota bacterium]|nr:dTDP-4-dehydrorhamnose reductase [Pseudomonadota bacterium]MDE3038666.1 dTDP-4-dehydrorhamnose reductase [Pseudomonadota bacterium]